jgi:hypothetical protein
MILCKLNAINQQSSWRKVAGRMNGQTAVTFRLLSVPHDLGDIGGFALWYKSEREAKADFTHFRRYISATGYRQSRISFDRDSDQTHALEIDLVYSGLRFTVRIAGIQSQFIHRLQHALNIFPYFFITAGYTENNGRDLVLPVQEYTYFSSRLFINGEITFGNSRNAWPAELFRVETALLLDEEN